MAGRPAPSAAPHASLGRSPNSSQARLPLVSPSYRPRSMRTPRAREEPSTPSPSATRARRPHVAGSTGRPTHPPSGMHGQVDLLIVAMKGPLVPGFDNRTRHQETLQVEAYSVPAPTGETTGSFCARMRAKGCRPQPRHGSSAIAATADGFDDGHALRQLTGGVFLDSRRPWPSAPFSCLPETVGSTISKQMPH
jgi:hypothetical protein